MKPRDLRLSAQAGWRLGRRALCLSRVETGAWDPHLLRVKIGAVAGGTRVWGPIVLKSGTRA